MRYTRIILVILISVSALGVSAWYFMGWALTGAFESGLKSKGFEQLSSVLAASVGSTLARGDVRLRPGIAEGEGAIAYYEKRPQELLHDKQYFQTWYSALAIARSALESHHQIGGWKNAAELAWVSPSEQNDAWGHGFCVESDQQRAIVVSPGPQALGSLDCNTLMVSGEELAQMPQGRLNPHASGALILFVKTSGTGPTADSAVDLKNGTLHMQVPRLNIRVETNPGGTFLTTQYSTTFAAGTATEMFTWVKSGGTLKLNGYHIQSNALILN
jgi:hypothetical protein